MTMSHSMEMLYVAVVMCVWASVHAYNKDIMAMYLSKISGQAVYYGKSQDGTCSYGSDLPPVATSGHIKHLVGLNPGQYADSITCGMCIRVRASGKGTGSTPVQGSFIGFVHSSCGGCEQGGIDLAEDGDGQWDVEYEAIQCPVEDTPIEYKFSGSDEWYIRMQVRNARVPVMAVHVIENEEEEAMSLTGDGFWEFSGRRLHMPLNIKLTAVTDEEVYDVISKIDNGGVVKGDHWAQFSFDWGLPGI